MKARLVRGITALGCVLTSLQGQEKGAVQLGVTVGTVTISYPKPTRRFNYKAKIPIRQLREIPDQEDWVQGRIKPGPGESVLYVDGPRRLELIVAGFACFPSKWHVEVQAGKKHYAGYIGGCDSAPLPPTK